MRIPFQFSRILTLFGLWRRRVRSVSPHVFFVFDRADLVLDRRLRSQKSLRVERVQRGRVWHFDLGDHVARDETAPPALYCSLNNTQNEQNFYSAL